MTSPPHLAPIKHQLLSIVREHGYRYSPEPFQLASGEMSHDFIDAKAALANGADLLLACEFMLACVADAGVDFDAAGGLTMGADQFAHGLAVISGKDWFVVRKERKGRGTNELVEGTRITKGTRVLLVDDIVTTGGSMMKAHQAIIDTGAQIVAAATLVDRGEVATADMDRLGIPYFPLITYRDLDIAPVGRSLVT
ncbi:MAG: orotate phosphoribosyltransferase [Euzebya sp.]